MDNKFRTHPLYKWAKVNPDDGLFHCPFGPECNHSHAPTKLKCNYDKFIDSHLKPYRCRLQGNGANDICGNLRFSSTACQLRHEREAHALHGHGAKPYLCKQPNCERGLPGNGFPRRWNCWDHMKRVHGVLGSGCLSDDGHDSSKRSDTRKERLVNPAKKRKVCDIIDDGEPTIVEIRPIKRCRKRVSSRQASSSTCSPQKIMSGSMPTQSA